MAGFCFSGPQARYHLLPEIDDGTLCRQVSPLPGPVSSFYLLPELHSPGFVASFDMIDADKEEFQIVKTMTALKSNHDSFKDAKDYVSYRDRYFGSSISYFLFAADSDAELANTSWGEGKNEKTLKSQIQFNGKNEGTKQQIFYRWVRKAYKLKFGGGFNVPETIRKGKSEQLIKKLNEVRESARVKKIHDENFSAGGFDARPQRYNEKYLLGTLSEHATGMAIDMRALAVVAVMFLWQFPHFMAIAWLYRADYVRGLAGVGAAGEQGPVRPDLLPVGVLPADGLLLRGGRTDLEAVDLLRGPVRPGQHRARLVRDRPDRLALGHPAAVVLARHRHRADVAAGRLLHDLVPCRAAADLTLAL